MDSQDKYILKLKREGKSLREIAKWAGISHVAVKKRLDKLAVNHTYQKQVNEGSEFKVNGTTEEKIKTSQYPNLDQAVSKLDEIIRQIVTNVKEDLNKSGDISIHTPEGWKIERIL